MQESQTAKLFMNGRSQAVRLPAQFRFDGDEVFIKRDAMTGDLILSPKPKSWDNFLNLLQKEFAPEDFLTDRDNEPFEDKDLF